MNISSQAKDQWDAFEAGDELAFRAFYDLTYAELYRYGYRLLPNKELVRDALQEMYLAIWQRRGKLPPVRNPWVFLLTTLRHKIVDEVRRNKELRVEAEPVPSVEKSLLELETQQQRQQWMWLHLQSLPERQREALHLRYRMELPYPEIAEVLGVSQQVAYNYVNRAIKTLKKALGEELKNFF